MLARVKLGVYAACPEFQSGCGDSVERKHPQPRSVTRPIADRTQRDPEHLVESSGARQSWFHPTESEDGTGSAEGVTLHTSGRLEWVEPHTGFAPSAIYLMCGTWVLPDSVPATSRVL